MFEFSKYHGCGNDFIVLNRLDGGEPLAAEVVQRLCDRHHGIGADGILSLWPDDDCIGRMQIQNADGSEAGNCGNGLRCMARFCYDTGLLDAVDENLSLRVSGKLYNCHKRRADYFSVDMGVAELVHPHLPEAAWNAQPLAIEVGQKNFVGLCHYFGNSHFSTFVDDVPRVLAEGFGAELESHAVFPDRANICFARFEPSGVLRAVVYERGVGITQACGSGACAVAVAAVRRGLASFDQPIDIALPGGNLEVRVASDYRVSMAGPAALVFRGSFE